MGLDMFLWKEVYVGAEYSHRNMNVSIDVTKDGKRMPINTKKVCEIREEAMYWRKANAIHNWFVQNVQGGNDDCKKYWVSIDHLKELRKTIKKVLKNHKKASELLPSSAGFFFGSTDYDSYYFDCLKETEERLTEIIKEYNKLTEVVRMDVNYYYESSW